MEVLPNIDVSDIMEIPSVFECDDQTLPCDHTSRFRTATGWCNNLNFPSFGKSFRAKSRLLRPSYEDGEYVCLSVCLSVYLIEQWLGLDEIREGEKEVFVLCTEDLASDKQDSQVLL